MVSFCLRSRVSCFMVSMSLAFLASLEMGLFLVSLEVEGLDERLARLRFSLLGEWDWVWRI